jgi:hypothetical protein
MSEHESDKVKTLAVAYEAYIDGIKREDRASYSVWGRILADVQRELNVTLVPQPLS